MSEHGSAKLTYRTGLAADGLLKSPLKLIGGKTGNRILSPRSRIYGVLPRHCTNFVEPFCGSGSILVGSRQYETEWTGDVNLHAIQFFRQLQKNPKKLYNAIMHAIDGMCKERYDSMRWESPDPGEEPFDAAVWYYIINKWARNGIVRFRKRDGKCNSTYCKEDNGRGILNPQWLEAVHNRIKDVEFHWTDYQNLIRRAEKRLDLDKTIIVLDPPYSQVFTKYDQIEFKDDDHIELASMLGDADYYWLLTINDNEFIRKLYSKWSNLYEVDCYWSCSNTRQGRGLRPELIITNYPLKVRK